MIVINHLHRRVRIEITINRVHHWRGHHGGIVGHAVVHWEPRRGGIVPRGVDITHGGKEGVEMDRYIRKWSSEGRRVYMILQQEGSLERRLY